MRRVILVLGLLFLAACETDQHGSTTAPPAAQQQEGAPQAAAPASDQPADAKGRTPFVHCIDLIREKRYAEAVAVCEDAQKSNPNDPQIQRAIEIAKSGGKDEE
jgi:hypothetical protein